MLIKRKWLLIVIALIILIGAGVEICSCNTTQNPDREVAHALGLSLREFEIIDTAVRECFIEEFAFLQDYPDFPIRYERYEKLEDNSNPIVIKAYGIFQLPSPSVTFGFRDGKTYIIATEFNPAGDS